MLPVYTEHYMKYGISMHILINFKKGEKGIWKCCHLPRAKQHLFLNDVFALVFLVSHQLSTSAIMLWRYILFFNIVFFVRVGSVLLSSHTYSNDSNESSIFYEYQCLPGNVWACYCYILILTSYILTGFFLFLCSHDLQSSVVSFLPHIVKIPAFNGSRVVTDPPPKIWDKQISASLFFENKNVIH